MAHHTAWLPIVSHRRGVRHGVDLKSGITIDNDEGRLYCNLIRSYVTFLMAEHERMTRTAHQ